ncbi:hypothetical protein J3L18_23140 [Mucilaginibacter gossypii]|uniref:hypothetical protein n=1 Tax=Mucilaginibacter gossypii TaxID=551996 RepID=UPI00101A98FE|nr:MULTISPECIES: hypothetical protein [Mucilaginibacter]QTE36011.1 hypothetical protein J3L18_23140 [Mucilaginibacter gossypii]
MYTEQSFKELHGLSMDEAKHMADLLDNDESFNNTQPIHYRSIGMSEGQKKRHGKGTNFTPKKKKRKK